MNAPSFTCNGVRAGYHSREILRGVSLELRPGEILSLLGENGSGKSTLLKVLAGKLPAAAGEIRFGGHAIGHLAQRQRQRLGIGYLMQGGRVFPNLTVAENLALAVRCASKMTDTQRPAPSQTFGALASRLRARAGLLSGGLRQMLAIEMVLAQRPSVLLLDEPTASLDRTHASELLLRLRNYAATHGASILLVEQDPVAAAAVSSRTLTLVAGTSTSNPMSS